MVTMSNGAPSGSRASPDSNAPATSFDSHRAPRSAPRPSPRAKAPERLTKRNLVDYRGKEVGRLRDVVINLGTGKVHYAVAEFEASWVAAGHLVTVRMPRDDMKVELNALMGAMIFDQKAWPDLNNPQFLANIDAYLAKQ